MHFGVRVGPNRSSPCDIVGELFLPNSASATHPVPVILTTNGFGGSYQDQVSQAKYFAPQGYAVLTYSGLGFGGSGCNIELDDPD
jgi:ABC-2 type transport system ATP-binding protein